MSQNQLFRTYDIFKPTNYALADLVNASRKFHFAIFVFAPDDVLMVRDAAVKSVRDNVIFEFGLFVGALGLSRCFLVTPRQTDPLHFPTDLLGLSPLTYATDRSDRDLLAALGPAANCVRRAIRDRLSSEDPILSPRGRDDERGHIGQMRARDFINIWNGADLMSVREAIRNLPSRLVPMAMMTMRSLRIRHFADSSRSWRMLADAVLGGEVDETEIKAIFVPTSN